MAARLLLVVLIVAIVATGCASRTAPPAAPAAGPPGPASARAGHENLNAVLWMQTAIEYETSAVQAYRLGRMQLDAALKDPRWTALVEPVADSSALTPAVILDIDETVLDNSYYQARLTRDNATFANDTWDAWCREARATAIPGAVEFTRYAAARGVTVFYVSNRMAAVEQATRANLRALGFPLDGRVDTVLLRGERPEWQASAKGPRRSHIAASHRVVMLVGDDLGDFVADASGSPEARRQVSARYQNWWGERWIMLPNPTYGSWERAVVGSAPDPVAAKRAALEVAPAASPEAGTHPPLRGIYGGVPQEILDQGTRLRDFGIDAVWLGSGSFTQARLALLRAENVRVYAEFNTLHVADYLKEHPDAAPIGRDGRVSPPPQGWQGICPTHDGYRRSRMDAFRKLLQDFAIDGVWLDYHHSHASWEAAEPDMPDTCFCDRCVRRFEDATSIQLPEGPASERASLLLSTHREAWVRWRLNLFTDWVREFRAITDATRPSALLGTFHNAWSDTDMNGARLEKLAIDLKAQAAYIDVFSPMVYHARFGHADDLAWISRQVTWLGEYLGIKGEPGERHRIWPIVQIADWGEPVRVDQVATVLGHGARRPSTGVMVFAWGGLRSQPEKIEAIGRAFRTMHPNAK